MEDYEIQCPVCGKVLDKRNPGQILSHGMKNPLTGQYECDEETEVPDDLTARRKGGSVEWTKDGKRIDLN